RKIALSCALSASIACGFPLSDRAAVPSVPGTTPGPATGPAPSIGNCTVFPPSNDWNRDISQDPIDARSSAYMAHMGAASLKLHADFGSNPMYGMPYVVVDG